MPVSRTVALFTPLILRLLLQGKTPVNRMITGYFAYTKQEMLAFGEDNGYSAEYIGDWNHPAGQRVVEYRKA